MTDHHDGGNAKGAHGRPLGRGLEAVSHLFLSRTTGDVPTQTGAPGSSPAAQSSTVLLRPMDVSRDQLVAILPPDWSGALEAGLRTIDARMPCHPCGELDVLAVDRTGRLTIIDLDTTPNDNLLLRGLGHVDWIMRNTQTVQRMCPGGAFDPSPTPRLILLAPQFSPLLRRGMRQITRPQIQAVRLHVAEAPAGPAILFEPVTGD